ncbi:MarR family winged helix-turn-helix transcriptional regulator [Brevibacillus centrosporus]|uniref:MarR family winged helix-turn-helix transcriptional regulator n=1 Tax=Brevibacillus centrosporus TaxID=54910 RepID=UPI002E1C3751|nr:MarR family transcriptional regulator [Brevibacillus centrosporus]MED1951982.1 MarR family transcriptional regulator [Brevibacillus centrosporus]
MTQPMNQKPEKDEAFLQDCLYFTTNRLSRAITRMADEAFATTGLAPAYGYLIRLVIGSPGITQKELSEKLSITPSTLTRFVDKLENKQLVERKVHGKTVMVYPTEKGIELGPTLRQASKRLKQNYEEILGKELSDQLTEYLTSSSKQLEK